MTQDLERVVELLVDEPERVDVVERREGRTRVLELSVAEGDLGKVIGRQGRTARALRTVLGARGVKDGDDFELEVLD